MRPEFDRLTMGSTHKTIYQGDAAGLHICVPSLPEQAGIATFLDRETAKIDALVADYRTLIELLQEKRQAVISHAVTKGLDPTVPMKDSGVEWLGEVPEHWMPMKVKHLFIQAKRQGFPDLGVLSVYRDYGVIEKDGRDDNFNKTPEDLSAYQLVEPGDLVINKMKAWQGSLGVSALKGITSPDYVVYASRHGQNPRFVHFMLRQRNLKLIYQAISNGIRPQQWRLEPDLFESLDFFMPPLAEQSRIVAYLQIQEERMDSLADEVEQAITLLQERRTALISAAVTGKIDVRGLVAIPENELVRSCG
jgi:type I restriction enzyme S subunit